MAGTTAYKNNWQKENVDRINLIVPKGRKDVIKACAAAQGESVNGFINQTLEIKLMDKSQFLSFCQEQISSLLSGISQYSSSKNDTEKRVAANRARNIYHTAVPLYGEAVSRAISDRDGYGQTVISFEACLKKYDEVINEGRCWIR